MTALFVSLGGTGYAASQLDHGPTAAVAKKKKKKPPAHSDNAADKKLFNSLLPGAHVAFAASAGSASTAGSAATAASATSALHATAADNATNATTATNAGNANQLGGISASGYQRAPRWALVQPNGTIVAQSGGIKLVEHTTGRYTLDFGGPVTGHLILASLSVAEDDNFRGPVSASPCVTKGEGDPVACAGGDDPNHLQVFTDNPGATATEDHAFYVAVL